jgi:hypothetical protein
MRLTFLLPLILCLSACHHGLQSNEAVRQGVLDHLAKMSNMNMAAMDITLNSVKFDGNSADAAVTITIKNAPKGMPMPFNYHLEQQNNKWVVVGRASSSHTDTTAAPAADPHGGGMPPAAAGAANPHGGGAAQMPSPKDLPPATKK